MNHDSWCPQTAFGHDDAAKRVCDSYNLHRLAHDLGAVGKWIACALTDGKGGNTLYDSKRDAVRHQGHNEMYFTFVKIGPQSMTICEAAVMLKVARATHDRGIRLADPDDANGGKDVIKRLTVEDQRNQSIGLNTNLRMPWEA